MTQLLHGFNPLQYDPTQGASQLPIGKHPVIIESSEVKANNNNTGGYLQLNLRVIDGPEKGATGVYRLSLYAATQEGCDAGHRKLSAICHVLQTFQLGQDGTQIAVLYNKPFVIEVGLQKGEEAATKGYTEVKKVFDMAGNEPGKNGPGAAQQPAGFGGQTNQQPQQQPQQNGQQGGAQAWGGQNNAPAPEQPQTGGGWNQGGNQQPAQNQGGGNWGGGQPNNAAAQGGNWGGNGAPSEKPSWGQRN